MYSIKILKVLYCKLCVKISLEYTDLRYFSNGNLHFIKSIKSGDLCRVSETCLIQYFKLNDTIFSRKISNFVRMLKFLILEIVTLCFKAKHSNKHSSASKALRVFFITSSQNHSLNVDQYYVVVGCIYLYQDVVIKTTRK